MERATLLELGVKMAGSCFLNPALHVGGVEAFLEMLSVPANVPTLDLHKFRREHINMAQIKLERGALSANMTFIQRLKGLKM